MAKWGKRTGATGSGSADSGQAPKVEIAREVNIDVEIVSGDEVDDTDSGYIHLATYGTRRSGKTRFPTTMPGLIGLVPLDQNSKLTFRQMEKENPDNRGRFMYPKYPLIDPKDTPKITRLNRIATAAARKAEKTAEELEATELVKLHYAGIADRLEELFFTYAANDEVSGVVGDTGTLIYDIYTLADFGRLESNRQRNRGNLNNRMRDLFNGCPKNMVMIHQPTQEWVKKPGAKAEDDRVSTGKLIMDAWPQTGLYVQGIVEHFKIQDRAELGRFAIDSAGIEVERYGNVVDYVKALVEEEGFPVFGMRLFDCQAQSRLTVETGLLFNRDCNFDVVMEMING